MLLTFHAQYVGSQVFFTFENTLAVGYYNCSIINHMTTDFLDLLT